MIPIKAILIGIVGVSFCMANISGMVTDTGTTPIAGAVVQLEKGGQTAITDENGQFTLVIGSTANLPGNNTSLPIGLSARISGNMLNVTITERSVVEVAIFDLNGKALSTVRNTLDAGSQSIALPQRGTGMYLYQVKVGNREFVVKGNSVSGAFSGISLLSPGSSPSTLAKQAMATVAINDVIAATKDGYLNYRCVQYNSDTTGIAIKMIASAGTVRDTDGNVYQTVRIGTQVWTVENLRVTKYNDGSLIPLDTSAAAWANATTPKYCFYNNTSNADSIKKYGALYNWYVVSPANSNKISPTGWHVPTDAEWDTLQNYLIAKGYNWDATTTGNNVAKSLASKTDWYTYSTTGTIGCDLTMNNSSGFSALPGGFRLSNGDFGHQSFYGYWWSATESNASDAWDRYLYCGYNFLYRYSIYGEDCGFSVRLVMD
jgi:uncharacterized protein (TIGR02145 family)